MHGHRSYAPCGTVPARRLCSALSQPSLLPSLPSCPCRPLFRCFSLSPTQCTSLIRPVHRAACTFPLCISIALPSLCSSLLPTLLYPLAFFFLSLLSQIPYLSPLYCLSASCLFSFLSLLLATLNQAYPLRFCCHNKWRPQHLTKRAGHSHSSLPFPHLPSRPSTNSSGQPKQSNPASC